MSSVNKAIVVGNVGKDPEIRSMGNGREVASFSLATAESWTDKQTGERKSNTDWHNIVIFNEHLVSVVKNYVKKGTKLFVEGQMKTRKWTDQSGVERYTTEVVLQFGGTLVLLSRKEEEGADDHNRAKQNGYAPEPELDDEIPF